MSRKELFSSSKRRSQMFTVKPLFTEPTSETQAQLLLFHQPVSQHGVRERASERESGGERLKGNAKQDKSEESDRSEASVSCLAVWLDHMINLDRERHNEA